MRTVIFALALLVVAVPASAQGSITRYDQQVFAPGVSPVTGAPQWTNTYLAGVASCGQAPIAVPASVVNPTRLQFDDPAAPGKVCIIALASALLSALPNGVGYVSTITRTDDVGQTSARSAASNPFDRQGVPSALTGLKLLQ